LWKAGQLIHQKIQKGHFFVPRLSSSNNAASPTSYAMSAFRTPAGSTLERAGSSLSGLNKFLSGPSSSSIAALTERTTSHDSEDVPHDDHPNDNASTTGSIMTTKSFSAVRGLAGSLKRGVSKRIVSPLKKQKSVPVTIPTSGGGAGSGSSEATQANYKMYPTNTTPNPTIETTTQPTTTTTTTTEIMKTIASLTEEEEKVKDYRTFFQEQLDVASDTFVPIDSINNGEETMGMVAAGIILNTMEDELHDAVIDNRKDDCHCAFCTIQ
jgi:hypothetical protein